MSWLRGEVRTLLLSPWNQPGSLDPHGGYREIQGRRAQARALSSNSGAHDRFPKSPHVANCPGQQIKLHLGLYLTLQFALLHEKSWLAQPSPAYSLQVSTGQRSSQPALRQLACSMTLCESYEILGSKTLNHHSSLRVKMGGNLHILGFLPYSCEMPAL